MWSSQVAFESDLHQMNLQHSWLSALPVEIWAAIVKQLPISCHQSVAISCSFFKNLIMDEMLWKSNCIKVVGSCCEPTEWGASSYRELYSKLLHPFKDCAGNYKLDRLYNGGLAVLKFDSGAVRLFEAEAHPHEVSEPLRLRPLICVKISSGQVVCSCVRDEHEHVVKYKLWGNRMVFDVNSEKAKNHRCFNSSYQGVHIFSIDDKPITTICCLPLEPVGTPTPDSPIVPGVYKGEYGPHGIEILQVAKGTDNHVTATKIRGDANVPAGETSWSCNLQEPLTFTRQEQEQFSCTDLMERQAAPGSTEVEWNTLAAQPFLLPSDADDGQEIPSTCQYRFCGLGQVAMVGFKNSSWIPVQVVVFSPVKLGVLWMQLRCLSIFERCDESEYSV